MKFYFDAILNDSITISSPNEKEDALNALEILEKYTRGPCGINHEKLVTICVDTSSNKIEIVKKFN